MTYWKNPLSTKNLLNNLEERVEVEHHEMRLYIYGQPKAE